MSCTLLGRWNMAACADRRGGSSQTQHCSARWGFVMSANPRPQDVDLITLAIDRTIAEFETRPGDERDDQLAALKALKQRWLKKAAKERRGL